MYYTLNSKKLSLEIYSFVEKHLDDIILISENKQELENNIKLFTYLYLENSGSIYFVEGFGDVLDTIKTIFWSTTLAAWSGKLSLGNWVGGMITNVAAGNEFTIGTSILAQIIRKILGVSNIPLTSLNIVDKVTSIQLVKVVSLALFPTVMVGMIIYKLINYNDILLIKNFETSVKSVADTLRLNTKELVPEISSLNTKYNDILVNQCSIISDNETKLKCASTNYVKYVTEDVLTNLISVYIQYLKKYNNDVSYITSFYDLTTLNINSSAILSKRLKYLYEFYIKLLNAYVFEEVLRKRYIQLLNDTVIKEINK